MTSITNEDSGVTCHLRRHSASLEVKGGQDGAGAGGQSAPTAHGYRGHVEEEAGPCQIRTPATVGPGFSAHAPTRVDSTSQNTRPSCICTDTALRLPHEHSCAFGFWHGCEHVCPRP